MLDLNFAAIHGYWDKALSYLKENRVAMLGLAGGLFIIIIQFVVLPVYKFDKSVNAQVKIVGGQLEQVTMLVGEYDRLTKAASGVGSAKSAVNLFARLENLTRKLKIAPNVDFMRPSSKTRDDGRVEEEVYIRFKSILQKHFVHFLYTAEVEGGIVSVKHLRMKKNKQGRFDIDIIFTKLSG